MTTVIADSTHDGIVDRQSLQRRLEIIIDKINLPIDYATIKVIKWESVPILAKAKCTSLIQDTVINLPTKRDGHCPILIHHVFYKRHVPLFLPKSHKLIETKINIYYHLKLLVTLKDGRVTPENKKCQLLTFQKNHEPQHALMGNVHSTVFSLPTNLTCKWFYEH